MTIPAGLKDGPIYLDYNATTPVDPQVLEVMWPYFQQHFGNPSSTHVYGSVAHEGVDRARQQVASLLGSEAKDIIFTGGGSEGDNLAIRGAALTANRGKHIITQVTEHPGSLNICRALSRLHGFQVTILPVDRSGLVDPAAVEAAIMPETCLITIMHANNETGTLQPIAEIAEIAHRHGVLMHSDAAQSVGKIPTRLDELPVDLLTIAGHKVYAPKGIGALYVRQGLQLEPIIYGGGQEAGRRAGTENIAYIVALGAACMAAQEQLVESQGRLRQLRDLLQRRLEASLPGSVHLNGHA
ncbi:MAG TPA: cysteine desulfurase family protein, partial [Ktedonobacteraceae bacterium]|nr:cysteine desulfurase family protein [Ktedonobacteraceae bacterium]